MFPGGLPTSDRPGPEGPQGDGGAAAAAPPAIALPKGGGAIRGIGEKFAANPVTGTGTLSVPLAVSPGRAGFGPSLALQYDSGAGNGPFGLGWQLSLPAITRKTDKGLPRYRGEPEDTFILSGAEDLVPVLEQEHPGQWRRAPRQRSLDGREYTVERYRPRIEGLFARIERWTDEQSGDIHWRSVTPDNVTTLYGRTAESRIADPDDPTRVFSWLLCESYDDRGNAIVYEYKAEDGDGVDPTLAHERNRTPAGRSANRHLKRVRYGNRTSRLVEPDLSRAGWLFEVVFDYGEHDPDEPRPEETRPWLCRQDPFSSRRPGFEVRSYRLCQRVLMFHHFPEEDGVGRDCLVRSTDLVYRGDPRRGEPVASFLVSVVQRGYRRRPEGGYLERSLPPLELGYSEVTVDQELHSLDPESVENLPYGLDGAAYRWVDLDGKGLSGILTEQADGWFYKPNLGDGRFGPMELVAARPSTAALGGGRQELLDLAGDGQLDLVELGGPTPGFYERATGDGWERFRPFTSRPTVALGDEHLRMVDLSGDGHADLLVTGDDAFTWFPSLAEEGFGPAERVAQPFDEERGPRLVFGDREQSVYLADMSGDGLPDIVRIRNGEVCYWPSLGYGRFGAKVTMDHAPLLDEPDQFDQRRVRVADIDGSGANDLVYLHRDGVRVHFNRSGNSWSDPRPLTHAFPRIDSASQVTLADLLGNGTACLVWSSPLPGESRRPLRYVDLMGGQKPHLLTAVRNNLGAETHIHYAPSTRFYLADQAAGRPWATRLPFPVHVVEEVEVLDRLNQTRYVTRHAYHHGDYDGQEREFRGFGMVEQWDTDSFARFAERDPWPDAPHGSEAGHHLPPVRTRSWFHTGASVESTAVSAHLAGEYYPGDPQARLLPDTVLPEGLTPDEAREACRALRGRLLRQEVYAEDGAESSPHPYAVTEESFTLRMLQPRRDGCFAVFLAHTREAVSYQYERDPADPRVSHTLTLAIDDYGNVTRAAAVAYPRRPTIPERLPEQARLHLTCSEAEFVNRADQDDFHLVKVPYEQRSYEVTGLSPAADGFFDWAEVRAALAAIPAEDVLPYEATPAGDRVQKRLLAHARTRYYRDDLAGPLGLGEVTAPLLPFEARQAVFGRALLEAVYGSKVGYDELAAVLGGQEGDQGGYVFEDELWWVPTGRQLYAADAEPDAAAAAGARFYLPVAVEDAFGQRTSVAYDEPYRLFPTRVEDPLGNLVQATIDYRVLQPWQVTDPNANRSQVAFDALGLVVATAVQGKDASVGDSLDGVVPDLSWGTIRSALDAPDPRAGAHALLGSATTRLVYDLFRYYDTQDDDQPQPNVVWSIARETHVSELAPGEATRLQHGFLYTDGLGREILTKAQAEPGPLRVYDPAAGRWRDEWAEPDRRPFDPRWVGSGRTVFDNKGQPVKQYEPFFSATHRYESEAQAVMQGVTPVFTRDPLGRVVRTDLPDETFTRVEFDPWQQTSWDPNDTVLESGWYRDRGQPDPATDPEPADPDRRAAWLAAVHANTPTVQHLDTLGRQFLTVTHNRRVERDPAGRVSRMLDIRVPARSTLDVEGNPLEIRDGRGIDEQPTADPLTYADGNVVTRYRYGMGGMRLYQHGMDDAERWLLTNAAGKPIRAWNSRGFTRRLRYDALQRSTHVFLQAEGAELLVERTTYGEGHPQAASRNLRGRIHRRHDGAGVATNGNFDFKGNLLVSSRQLAREWRVPLNWSIQVPLEDETYTQRSSHDALNRPIRVTTPDRSELRPTYNEANQLEAVEADLRGGRANGQPVGTTFVANIDYSATGQRERVATGAGVVTTYEYDPFTFRLTSLRSVRAPAGSVLQDLHYTYDPVGNITAIRDEARQTVFFNNSRVSPEISYVYDALYQLISATGREHIGQTGQADQDDPPLLHPNDSDALRRYTERYEYDAAGNILALIHRAGAGGWTRRYQYAAVGNRLLSTSLPGDDPASGYSARYEHDAHGNMTSMPHLPLMEWDDRDLLRRSSRQVRTDDGVPEITYHVYDAAGQRIRKVTERQAAPGETPARKNERLYLSGLEIYREYSGDASTISLERETLEVTDGRQRIALVETKTVDVRSPGLASNPLVRYQLGDHLGSTSLEVDAAGRVISSEEYRPYGTTAYHATRGDVEVSPKRYRYTGKERDEETGLYYHGARYYASWLGRWCSVDPGGLVDGLNLYAYVRNRPTALRDVTGLAEVPPDWLLEMERQPGMSLAQSYALGADEGPSIRAPSEIPMPLRSTASNLGYVREVLQGISETRLPTPLIDLIQSKFSIIALMSENGGETVGDLLSSTDANDILTIGTFVVSDEPFDVTGRPVSGAAVGMAAVGLFLIPFVSGSRLANVISTSLRQGKPYHQVSQRMVATVDEIHRSLNPVAARQNPITLTEAVDEDEWGEAIMLITAAKGAVPREVEDIVRRNFPEYSIESFSELAVDKATKSGDDIVNVHGHGEQRGSYASQALGIIPRRQATTAHSCTMCAPALDADQILNLTGTVEEFGSQQIDWEALSRKWGYTR